MQDPNEENWLAHRYTRLDNTSPMKLKEILTELDGACFSPFTLNAITRTGTKAKVEPLLSLFQGKAYRTGAMV